jgi:nucleoside-diphosphate-sugar epimerase
MKIFIIGGTGNISSSITKMVQGLGHDITLFNFDTARPDWLLQEVRVISGSRKNLILFKDEILANGKYDCVIDMICFEPEDAEQDIFLFQGNTEQFIFCSTIDVYSKTPDRYPVDETFEISARPTFQYGFKKVRCEMLFWAADARGDFQLTVLRPAFTYNEAWSPGVHSFGGQSYHLDRIRKGKPFIMHGDGNSIWVASHRDDTARAFYGAIGNKLAYGHAYNVNGDEMMTHNHIWRTIAKLMGAPEPDFVYIPTDILTRLAPAESEWCRENFMHNVIVDNSKARRDLGFRYTISFEEGAERCLTNLLKNDLIEDCGNYPFYDAIIEKWQKAKDNL